MTRREAVKRVADVHDHQLVLQERPLRPGTVLADTARFGDDVWEIEPALLQRHERAHQLNFTKLPERYRPTAKHLFYAMLSGELPPGERRLAVISVFGSYAELRRFLDWLTTYVVDEDLPALAELSPSVLKDYRGHLAANCKGRLSAGCSAIRQLWRFRRLLPDPLSFDPLREIEDWSVPHSEKQGENATPRIPEEVLGPLLTWSLRFVDDFAPDILAAQEIWVRARSPHEAFDPAAEPAPLMELLDTHRRLNRPLPGRNGKVNVYFLAGLTGVGRARLRRRIDLINAVATEVGIDEHSYFGNEIHGKLGDSSWIDGIASDHCHPEGLATLARMLQIACYIVISYLSGMRDSEVKHLQRGSIQACHDSEGKPYRWRIHSLAFKGEDAEGVSASWVVSASVHRAVAVLEHLQSPTKELLFAALPHSPGGRRGAPDRALCNTRTNSQLNEFRDWINQYCTRRDRVDIVPLVKGQQWRLYSSQFRRTLAWYIARQPGGSIAGAIQYRHMSVQMFEGYAGTSDSGFRAEVEAEMALARGEFLLNAIEAHEHADLAGPAAAEASRRLAEFSDHAAPFCGSVVTDVRRLARLMKRHDPGIYPGRYATCIFNPDKALCTRVTDTNGISRPALGDCKPLDCKNVALTSDNLAALSEELQSLRRRIAARPPLPIMLYNQLTARAETLNEFINRYGKEGHEDE